MNFKKGISIGLALSIALGSSMTALASPNELVKSLGESKEREMVLQAQIQQEPDLQILNDSDQVRVIVELESEAVIEKATKNGLKLDDMSKSEVGKLQNQVLKEQSLVQRKMNSKKIDFEVINSFTNVANGFSAKTTLEQAKKIEGIPGVKSVTIANEYERPEPMMNSSGEIIKTNQTWANGYNGEGTVVAVIDSGIDSTHKDMVLTNQDKAELQEDEVQAISKKNELPGTYRTSKVPYGYNYMDNNQEILDLGEGASHGMHVSGIVGANGDVDNGGIKGVAPEAQILGMKVFGNDPSASVTFGDVVVKAIDDSVLLGADVINMSLGSTASFVDDKDLEQAAVNRAVENGVVMAISAGNANVFGRGYKKPYTANTDYGVVGAPGLSTDSLQVASIENNIVHGKVLEYNINGEENAAIYAKAGTDILDVYKGKELKLVDCGLGGLPEHFPAEVKGNVALIQRGVYDFSSKIANAEKAGAIAVVVYNHASGGDELMNMMYPEGGTIPALFIGNSHGAKIATQLKTSEVKFVANGNDRDTPNPLTGTMSDFTSWGTTPNLEFKPEITAPGGKIWSTDDNDSYASMNGTSMASPHVAGGAALVLQRIDKDFGLTGEARARMAKKLMMSTAIAHVDNGKNQAAGVVAGANYTSPRRQGAGVMDLQAATTTSAIVTDTATGECKVNLKEIKGNSAVFTIEVENFSDKELTYNVEGTVQTDLVDEEHTYLEAQNIVDKNTNKFPISFSNNAIKVAAKGKTQITTTVDLSNAITGYNGKSIEEVFVNGGYVEGFVTLTDPTDTNPTLSIPYMGFKGEWDKAPAIDASIYDKERTSFYGLTSIATDKGEGKYDLLGFDLAGKIPDGNKIDFSPNGDGVIDTITPILSYLRNMKELQVEVLDSNGKVIRSLAQELNEKKHYFNDGREKKFKTLTSATWDGTVNNKVVEDGTYTYRVKGKVDYENADWQNFDFKVNVDTTAPTVNKINYNKNTKQLEVVAEDNNQGHIYKYVLISDGKAVEENATGQFDLSKLDYTKCSVEVYDYAKNKTSVKVTEATTGEYKEPTGPAQGDTTIPTVMLTGPEFFGVLNNGKVTVAGTVKDASAIAEFTINGKNVPLTFDTHTGLWNFSTEVELEDGYHSIKIAARDAANNKIEFAHKMFVDTTAPAIDLEAIPTETTKNSIVISGKISDNLPNLKIKVNGNVVKTIEPNWEYFNDLPSASYDLAYEVNLEDGENKIAIEAIDKALNATVKEVTINKVSKIVESTAKLYGNDRYETAVEVSKAGWDNSDMAVIANGLAYADALVAAPLASNYDAPILLTEANGLPDVTKAELSRLGVKTIYVVGGTTVVSEAAVKEMTEMGIDVVRLGGENRYETSLEIAKHLDRQENIENIYVAGGNAPADALSIASKAATDRTPIILVETKSVPKNSLAWLKDQKLKSAYVIGGETVVKNSVIKDLNKITSEDITNNRIGGANRYETNALVIEKLFAKEQKNVYVTESVKLVDSLVVSSLAAKTGSPVIITDTDLSTTQKSIADKMLAKNVIEVGGKVSKTAVEDLINRINNK